MAKTTKKLCDISTIHRDIDRCLAFARGGQHTPRCRPRAPAYRRKMASKQNGKVLPIRYAPTILIHCLHWAPFEARANWKQNKFATKTHNMAFWVFI